MDFLTFLQTLARRWVLVVAGLLITAVGITAVLRLVPPGYEASTSLLLTVPVSAAPAGAPTSDPGQVNPYLAFGAALNVNAELLADVLDSRDAREMVQAAGGTGYYGVSAGQGAAPVINVIATSGDAGTATATARTVGTVAARLLSERQRTSGAPPSSWIRVAPLTGGNSADRKTVSTIRALVSVAVLGIAATVLLAFTVEGMARRRRARSTSPRDTPMSLHHNDVLFADADDAGVVVAPPVLSRRVADR
jgi:capsular polysaccharide biosynthesis protein